MTVRKNSADKCVGPQPEDQEKPSSGFDEMGPAMAPTPIHDAKVAAAAALWFGFPPLTGYLVYASLFGGALTLLMLQFRQWPLPRSLISQEWAQRLHRKDSGIPYGIALALGALLVVSAATTVPRVTHAGAPDAAHAARPE